MNILKPKFFIPYIKKNIYGHNYPVYAPPHRKSEKNIGQLKAKENFDYFLSVRSSRVEILKAWMIDKFRISLDYNSDSLRMLERWISLYGGIIIGKEPDCLDIYNSYKYAFDDKLLYYNIIHDIGIFLGEYVISKRNNIYWDMYTNNIDGKVRSSTFYQKPMLSGSDFEIGNAIFVPMLSCAILRQYIYIGSSSHLGDVGILSFIKTALYMSTVKKNESNTKIGDLKDGPLE